jgi:Winged helix DNA-binding domain
VERGITARRLRAQLLSGPRAERPVDVAARLLAIQGQDPRGARLAIRSRTAGLTAADVDRALTEDRSLLITWLNRRTLHLVRSEDYWLLQRLTVRPGTEQICVRNIVAAGGTAADAEKAVDVITRALTSDGPLTRIQLRERLVAAGLPTSGNAALHMLTMACLRGTAVRGPMVGPHHAYVLVRDWLGQPPRLPDRDVALAELARRFLVGHGPASDRDLAKWAGLSLTEVRRGLTAISAELTEREDGLAELAASAGDAPEPALPAPRLLGAYDPVLHGWVSRDPILGPHQQIVTVNGLFRPFALVDGRAAAIWAWTSGQVVLERLGEFSPEAEAALAAEAADVRRFLGSEPVYTSE